MDPLLRCGDTAGVFASQNIRKGLRQRDLLLLHYLLVSDDTHRCLGTDEADKIHIKLHGRVDLDDILLAHLAACNVSDESNGAVKLVKTEESVKLHAFLAEAKPAAFQNGELILRFPHQYKFHYNTVSQDENLRLIGQVVGQLTGAPAKVIAELENEAGHIKQELTLVDEVKKMFGDVPIEMKD